VKYRREIKVESPLVKKQRKLLPTVEAATTPHGTAP
jgi:hypothetical protein